MSQKNASNLSLNLVTCALGLIWLGAGGFLTLGSVGMSSGLGMMMFLVNLFVIGPLAILLCVIALFISIRNFVSGAREKRKLPQAIYLKSEEQVKPEKQSSGNVVASIVVTALALVILGISMGHLL